MDSSKLIERGGLVYHLKPNSLFHGKGVKISDTPFNGKAVKHYSSGEVQIKATYKDGISIQFSYLGIDGTVLESSEIIGDTTIESNWNINGQKYFERRTIGGTIISVKRWYEDGTIRQEPFDWEKKTVEDENFYHDGKRPLNYIIKKPLDNVEKQDVLFFMHGHSGHIWYYEPHMINQFDDSYIKIILQAPYELSLGSNEWTWFDFHIPFLGDTTFNEQQINESCEAILFSIDKIIEKEKINPRGIFVGGNSQGGVMACKIALEHPDKIDGFIAHNTFLPVVYQTATDRSKYTSLKGLVINGQYDTTIKPINSTHISNTFLSLGAKIKSTELKMGHEFPKLSRDVINEWMVMNN